MKTLIHVILILTAVLVLLAILIPAAPPENGIRGPAAGGSLDPRQSRLFEKLGVLEAWELTKGRPEVTIGVIENGFDFFHPALKDNLLPGYYAPGGYHTEISDSVAHGTMITSLIAARPFLGGEMSGLAPGCKILAACLGLVEQPLLRLKKKFDQEHPGADLSEFQKVMAEHVEDLKAGGANWANHMARSTAEAVRYLVDSGVRVVNISAFLRKGLVPSPEVWEALDGAFRYAAEKDVLIVLGAGNNAQECDDYPGEAGSMIVVGAATLDDKRWEMEMTVGGRSIKQGSNFGARLTVMAPSTGLLVCAPHEPRFYSCDDGPTGPVDETFESMLQLVPVGATSCATPVVTALAALVRSLRPELPISDVIEIVKRGCDDIGDPGYDNQSGHGRVNYQKTLNLAREWKK